MQAALCADGSGILARAIPICPVERASENLPGIRFLHPRHLLGSSLRDDSSALLAAFGSTVLIPWEGFTDSNTHPGISARREADEERVEVDG